MTVGLTRRGEGPAISYAGTPLHVLAGADGTGPWAAAEIVVPARFRGPVPHVHDTFDEGIFVIDGCLQVVAGRETPVDAPSGSLFTARRGTRHAFSNPGEHPARVLGFWSPARAGLDFMAAVGAVLPASGPPDVEALRAVYEQHQSRLEP
jgi:mannose-6-phosphate isomerase-like protein (cupin superfamily)